MFTSVIPAAWEIEPKLRSLELAVRIWCSYHCDPGLIPGQISSVREKDALLQSSHGGFFTKGKRA